LHRKDFLERRSEFAQSVFDHPEVFPASLTDPDDYQSVFGAQSRVDSIGLQEQTTDPCPGCGAAQLVFVAPVALSAMSNGVTPP